MNSERFEARNVEVADQLASARLRGMTCDFLQRMKDFHHTGVPTPPSTAKH